MSACITPMQKFMGPLVVNLSYSSCYLMELYKTGDYLNSTTLAATDCVNRTCTSIVSGLAQTYSRNMSCTIHDVAKNVDFALYEIGNICSHSSVQPKFTGSPTSVPISTPSTNKTTIIIVVVAAVVFVCVAIAFIWYCRKNRKSEDELDDISLTLDMSHLEMDRISTKEVTMVQVLARGAYGEVWLGQCEGQMVAVKKLLNHKRNMNELQNFIHEIALIAKMESPYIVKFIGVAWSRPVNMMLITEYMNAGDLRSTLQSNAQRTFTWNNKIHCAYHIAEALVYLHSLQPMVIHRDLKSRNVLLNTNMQAKLTDFGISRELDDATMTAGIGTYRWMAPEVLQNNHYTESADIYSFGVILAELSTEIVPYSDLRNHCGNPYTDAAIMAKVTQGLLQPSFCLDCPSWFVELGTRCLAVDPENRPTALEASHIIKTQLQQLN